MFGVALWDTDRGRAVIARDRIGVKPLYYAENGDVLVFASELKSLLAIDLMPTDLDYEAIDAYLALGYFGRRQDAAPGSSKATPGHRLVVAGRLGAGSKLLGDPKSDAG